MADAKISALPSATTPLAGTETFPLVQSGATKKATIADVTNRLGLGTMATQNATSVAISGGSVNGTPIGASSPSTGKFSNDTSAESVLQTNPGTPGIPSNPSSELFTIGFSLAGGASQDISAIDPGTNWTAVFIGACVNTYEGGSLVTQSNYYEVNQTNNTISVGSTSIVVSRNSSTGKLKVTNANGTYRVGFSGVVLVTADRTGLEAVNSMTLQKNLVIGTAAKGVNFTANTPAAGLTSQLLNWYEEGTWTPSVTSSSGTNGTLAYTSSGTYTRIGRQVTLRGEVSITNWGSRTGAVRIGGVPFTAKSELAVGACILGNVTITGVQVNTEIGNASTSQISFAMTNLAGNFTYLQVTDFAVTASAWFEQTYFV